MNNKYQKYSSRLNGIYPYDWHPATIKRIVDNYEYCGHLVSNVNTKQSVKSKKLIRNDESEWIIVKNTFSLWGKTVSAAINGAISKNFTSAVLKIWISTVLSYFAGYVLEKMKGLIGIWV